MFKVGNNIKGLKDNGYFRANENMIKALVVYTNNYPTMGIKILFHNDKTLIGNYIKVENNESMFKLL